MSDATNDEVDLIADILDGEGHQRVRQYIHKYAAEVSAAALTRTLFLREVQRAYGEHGNEVFSDPFLEKKAWEEFELQKRTHPEMQIDGSLDRPCRRVIDRYGSADTRAINDIRRDRRQGARGRKNPNLMADDDASGEGTTAEHLEDQEIAVARSEQIAKIAIDRHGRRVSADPEFGRNQVQRQRAATVAERERAGLDLDEAG